MSTIRRQSRASKPRDISPALQLALLSGVGIGPGLDTGGDQRVAQLEGAWDVHAAWGDAIRGQGPDPWDAAWTAHGDELREEAARAGFCAFRDLNGESWTPEERQAERRWRETFMTEHERKE